MKGGGWSDVGFGHERLDLGGIGLPVTFFGLHTRSFVG